MSERRTITTTGDAAHDGAASPRVHLLDVYVAGVVLAICGALYLRTFWFDSVPSSLAQNVQPAVFPRLVLAVTAVLALLLPFEHYRQLRRGIDLDEERRSRPPAVVFVTAAALVLFVGVMPWLGTFAGLLLISGLLPLLWGERRWRILVPYALIFPTAVIWLFSQVLRVTFLPGIFGYVFGG